MIAVPPELLTTVHDYLMNRPMREVEGLVGALRQCKPIETSSPATDPDKSANDSGKSTSKMKRSPAG